MKQTIYKAGGLLVGLLTVYIAVINFFQLFLGPLDILKYISFVVFLACISYLLLKHESD